MNGSKRPQDMNSRRRNHEDAIYGDRWVEDALAAEMGEVGVDGGENLEALFMGGTGDSKVVETAQVVTEHGYQAGLTNGQEKEVTFDPLHTQNAIETQPRIPFQTGSSPQSGTSIQTGDTAQVGGASRTGSTLQIGTNTHTQQREQNSDKISQQAALRAGNTRGISASPSIQESKLPSSVTCSAYDVEKERQLSANKPVVQGSPDASSPREQHTVAARQRNSRPTIRVVLPDGWARSAFAGIVSAFVGWAVIVTLTLVGYLSLASHSMLGAVKWNDAVRFGGDLWATVFGAPWVHEGTQYLLMPTLLGILLILFLRALLIPGQEFPAVSQWAAVPGFALASVILIALSGSHASLIRALCGSTILAALSAGWAVASQTESWPQWVDRLPWVWSGLRQGRVILGALAVLSLAAGVWSLVAGGGHVAMIHQTLQPSSRLDDVVIILAQILLIPTFMAWVLSWLAGPGFHIGADAFYSPVSLPRAPIPGIPLLGAIPTVTPGYVVVFALVACGVIGGIWISRRHRYVELREQLLAALSASAVVTVVISAWMLIAHVKLGSGRLAFMGPRTGWVVLFILLEVVLIAECIAIASHPVVIRWTRDYVRNQMDSVLRKSKGILASRVKSKRKLEVDDPKD